MEQLKHECGVAMIRLLKPLKNAKNALTTGSGCAILKPIRCMTNTTVETVTRIVQF